MNRSSIRLSSPLARYAAQAADVLTIWLCGFGAYTITADFQRFGDMPLHYELVMFAASLTLLAFSPAIYRSRRGEELRRMLHTVAMAWGTTVTAVVVWLFLSKTSTDFSRLWLITWALATVVMFFAQRLAVYGTLRWLRSHGYNYKSLLLVGSGSQLAAVRESVHSAPWSGMQIVGELEPDAVAAYLNGRSGERGPDEVWICASLADEAGIRTTLAALRHSTANIRVVPDFFAMSLINHGVSEIVGIPMLDLSASPFTGMARLLKQVEDYVAATIILMVVAVPMVFIAIAIKVSSSGPVLYRQKRHGWNGQEIVVYKFRTMVVHTEANFQVTQASHDDPRITKLGAFLRRTSLDELPQFINVLQGCMSVVGPRPHALAHNQHYKEVVPGYMLRHKVKPGVTGWAQVNGFRGETDTLEKMAKRVEYDLYYINNWSLFLDIQIILRSFSKGFVSPNAY